MHGKVSHACPPRVSFLFLLAILSSVLAGCDGESTVVPLSPAPAPVDNRMPSAIAIWADGVEVVKITDPAVIMAILCKLPYPPEEPPYPWPLEFTTTDPTFIAAVQKILREQSVVEGSRIKVVNWGEIKLALYG